MKVVDLRNKTSSELKEDLLSLRREQFNLRMQRATATVKLGEFKRVRRDIARVKTVLNELKRSDKL